MYGEPALPPGFHHLPYANPEAPKGGRIVLGELGSFDSLNPFILKGNAPWGLRAHVFESLLGRSWDEPFTLYGLLAESVETDPARTYVEFTLRREARFSDGSPVTVADVLWSFETLAAKGLPNFAVSARKVARMEQTGPRSLRITFAEKDRELPLILGLRPILKKADWEGRDFAASSLRVPVGSGPYVIGALEPGRFISFRRNPDYWGRDLALNRGQHNFDEIRYDYYRDAAALFEAFRAGLVSAFRESDPNRWAKAYDFPAVRAGRIVLSHIPHGRPSGMRGFVFNTRRPLFADWRVREALILAFNFEWINARLNGDAFRRITSYFANSPLAYSGPATGREAELLALYGAELPPGTLEGYALPRGDAEGTNRRNLRRARELLAEAGWRVENGTLVDREGSPFAFEILLRAAHEEAVATIFVDSLRVLGIAASIRLADAAQYNALKNAYDYDMIVNTWALSLSPGNEQNFYWGSEGRGLEGTRNYMGVAIPAVDGLIATLLEARTTEEFIAAVRALDRVLTAGRYVIPFWYAPENWIAHEASLHYPARLPLYGDWPGFLPEVWWRE
ncbi:MAG TPA: extracellular solute-binding protein [Paracoccaceae bacterium]|nr:extracellular solute-binding protein [Paracoccaceae bacterium]